MSETSITASPAKKKKSDSGGNCCCLWIRHFLTHIFRCDCHRGIAISICSPIDGNYVPRTKHTRIIVVSGPVSTCRRPWLQVSVNFAQPAMLQVTFFIVFLNFYYNLLQRLDTLYSRQSSCWRVFNSLGEYSTQTWSTQPRVDGLEWSPPGFRGDFEPSLCN